MTVEIAQSNGLYRTTMWCWRCIRDAEHRSRAAAGAVDGAESAPVSVASTVHASAHDVLPNRFHQLVQEHFNLMERALHEDDTILVPLIDDFMQRCRTYQAQLEEPTLTQRLEGHLQYWNTFLQALNQSGSV